MTWDVRLKAVLSALHFAANVGPQTLSLKVNPKPTKNLKAPSPCGFGSEEIAANNTVDGMNLK